MQAQSSISRASTWSLGGIFLSLVFVIASFIGFLSLKTFGPMTGENFYTADFQQREFIRELQTSPAMVLKSGKLELDPYFQKGVDKDSGNAVHTSQMLRTECLSECHSPQVVETRNSFAMSVDVGYIILEVSVPRADCCW
jgi:hypothetical protein